MTEVGDADEKREGGMEGGKRETKRDETRGAQFIFMFMYDVFAVGTQYEGKSHQLVGLGGFCQ